jgi:hypothetical protein
VLIRADALPGQTFRGTILGTVTDPSGAVTISRFDGRNRLIETRLQSSADAKDYLSRTTYEYDPADKLGRVSASVRWLAGSGDPVAARTTYIYEARALLDEVGESVAIAGTVEIEGMFLSIVGDPTGMRRGAVSVDIV